MRSRLLSSNIRSVIPGSPRNFGALRPGLIILVGVLGIALLLIIVLLLPPPNIRGAAERLIPPGALIVSELNYGDLIGMSGSTEASLIDVARFYRERLRLGRGAIVGGGISSWSESRLFRGARAGVTMPYTTEGFVIMVRDKNELLVVIASRATNENATSIEVFCERNPDNNRPLSIEGLKALNRANRFGPPEGVSGSSASGLRMRSAIFRSSAQLTNILAHYFTNVLTEPPAGPTNGVVSPAGNAMISTPKRAVANSATFFARPSANETVLIHCYRSAGSTQTHVLVGCSVK